MPRTMAPSIPAAQLLCCARSITQNQYHLQAPLSFLPVVPWLLKPTHSTAESDQNEDVTNTALYTSAGIPR